MTDPILFNPENRLLGASTGDFGLYGGQSDPQFSVHQARDDAAGALDRPAPATDDTAHSGEPPTAQDALSATGGESDNGAGTLAPAAFLISAPAAPFQPVSMPGQDEQISSVTTEVVSIPHGAGSFTPAGETTDTGSSASQAALSDGVVTGTAAHLLDDLAGGAPIATGLISPIGDTVGHVLEATTHTIEDTLSDLAGSDPLGGVETLVSLVSVSDMFDLNPVDAPVVDAAGDSGLGMLDSLVGEELVSDTLLGAHHEDGPLLGDHSIDHPLGL